MIFILQLICRSWANFSTGPETGQIMPKIALFLTLKGVKHTNYPLHDGHLTVIDSYMSQPSARERTGFYGDQQVSKTHVKLEIEG